MPLPPELTYLWRWWVDLSLGRPAEAGAIPYSELLAWQLLTGERTAPWEVRALRAIDRELIRFTNELLRQKKPGANG